MALIGISGKISSGKDTIGKILQILLNNPHLNNEGVLSFLKKDINFDSPYYKTWQIKKFADKLKDIICILLGCTREQLEDREFKEKELGEEWWYYKSNINYGVDLGYTTDFEFIKNQLIPYSDSQRYTEVINKLDNNPKFKGKYGLDLIKLTPRLLLQLLGTQIGREIIHPNIWVNALMSEYDKGIQKIEKSTTYEDNRVNHGYNKNNFIITDTRFPNELKAVKDRKGITIRIDRFKEGDKVYWTDPDTTEFAEGASSGVYSIIKLYDEFCLLSNDVGSEAEVPYHEIKLYIEDQHESETVLDNAEFDYVIQNIGTLEDLTDKVREIIVKEKLLKKISNDKD